MGLARELRADVVIPALGDGASDARHQALCRVVEIIPAPAAFDVTPTDVQRHRVGRIGVGGGGISGDLSRRTPESGAQGHQRGVRRRSRSARGCKIRVAAVDGRIVEKAAAGRNLPQRTIVRVHVLRVHVGVLVEFEVTHDAHGVAGVRTLVVVQRTEVVLIARVHEIRERVAGASSVDRQVIAGTATEVCKAARIRRTRTTAGERPGDRGTQRARGVIVGRLQDRIVTAISGVGSHVAAAVFGADPD